MELDLDVGLELARRGEGAAAWLCLLQVNVLQPVYTSFVCVSECVCACVCNFGWMNGRMKLEVHRRIRVQTHTHTHTSTLTPVLEQGRLIRNRSGLGSASRRIHPHSKPLCI